MSNTLPPNTGYVAAAYLVFLLILLIYIVIMAMRAARVERELAELLTQSQQRAAEKTEAGSQ
jgi:cell division protein FtsL